MSQKIQLFCDRCSDEFTEGARLNMNAIGTKDGERRDFLGGYIGSLRGIELCDGCANAVMATLGPRFTERSEASEADIEDGLP